MCNSVTKRKAWGSDSLEAPGQLPKNHHSIGALIIRIGFWSLLFYNHNKEPPK